MVKIYQNRTHRTPPKKNAIMRYDKIPNIRTNILDIRDNCIGFFFGRVSAPDCFFIVSDSSDSAFFIASNSSNSAFL